MKLEAEPSRRSILQTLAIGAGVAPALAPLGRAFLPKAHAAEGGAPRRIIFFENPNGLPGGIDHTRSWYFTPGATFADGVFGFVLQPLERHRAHMTVMQNLEPYSAPVGKGTSSHRNANIQMYTGCQEADSQGRYYGRSRNASIDWHLAQTLGKRLTPKFPMLMTGIQCPGQTHTYTENGDWVPNHNMNPYDLYAKLFGDLVVPGGTTSTPAAPDKRLLARLAARKSALDHVKNDLAAFSRRLSPEDRARAEIQLDAIRTLEQRLGAGVAMPGTSAAACRKPVLEPQGLDWKFPNSRNVPALGKMMNEIVVAALACDQTRIVSMMNWGGDDHHSTCNFDPVNTPQGWHSLSHLDPSKEKYRVAKMWLSGVLAELVDKLKAIPEAGGTMLDNTLILMAQDHGLDHGHHTLQLCALGGKNLGVNVSSYIKCGDPGQGKGWKLSRLLVSLLNAMGSPEEKWGVLDTGKGGLEGFLRA
jgi:hypothetical protein